jgi:hypothetical protein
MWGVGVWRFGCGLCLVGCMEVWRGAYKYSPLYKYGSAYKYAPLEVWRGTYKYAAC